MARTIDLPPKPPHPPEDEDEGFQGVPNLDNSGFMPHPDTFLEKRSNLRQAVELAKNAGVYKERTDLATEGEARKKDLKDYLRAEGVYKNIRKPTAEQTTEFEAARAKFAPLNEKYTAAQLTYAAALQGSVRERLVKAGKSPEEIEKITKRYNKWIRTKEILLPNIKQKQDVREELLDEPGKNALKRGLRWYQKANKKLENRWKEHYDKKPGITKVEAARKARVAARATRVVGFAVAGLAVGTGIAVAGTGAGIGGAVIGGRLLWSALSFGAGMRGGLIMGDRFSKSKGAERAAYKEATEGEVVSAADLEEQEAAHAVGSEEAIDKGREKRENFVSLFTSLGLSTSALIHAGALESIKDAASLVWNEMKIPEAHAETITNTASAAHTVANAAHAVPGGAPAAAPATSGSLEQAERILNIGRANIHTPGEGTSQLFVDLKQNLHATLPRHLIDNPPPALKHLLETNPNVLSREIGPLFGEHGMTTHAGDQFFVDEHQNVYYQPQGGEKQLFLENNTGYQHGYAIHQLHTNPPHAAEAPPAHAETPPPSHPAAAPVAEAHPPAPAAETAAQPPGPDTPTIERGEGADSMLYELHHQLRAQYGHDLAHAPKSVLQFLKQNPHHVGESLGFSGQLTAPDGHVLGPASRIMHEGDRFFINDQHQISFYDKATDTTTVVIDEGGTEHVLSGNLHLDHAHATGAHAHEVRSTQHHAGAGRGETPPAPRAPGVSPEAPPPPSAPPPANGSGVVPPTNGAPTVVRIPSPTDGHPGSGDVARAFQGDQQPGPIIRIPDGTTPVPAIENAVPNLQGGPPSGPVIRIPTERAPGISDTAPAAAPTIRINQMDWTPQQGMPQVERAVFTVNPGSNLSSLHGGVSIYAHAETPEKSLALAQEYGMKHPDTKIAFDNSEDSGWLRGKTERVGIVEFDRYGHIKTFEPGINDADGSPVRTVDSNSLQQWIT